MNSTMQKDFSIKSALSFAYRGYINNILVIIGSMLLYLVYYSPFLIAAYFINHQLKSSFTPEQIIAFSKAHPEKVFLYILAAFSIGIIMLGISSLAHGGLINLALKIYNNGTASISDFFISKKQWWNYFKLTLLAFALLVPAFLLIIPGAILLIIYMFSIFIIFDSNVSVMESLRQSKLITKGKRWKLFFTLICYIVLTMILFSLLIKSYLVQQIISYVINPFLLLSLVHIYKELKSKTNLSAE